MNENQRTAEELAQVHVGMRVVERNNWRHELQVTEITADPNIQARQVTLKDVVTGTKATTSLGSFFTFYKA